MTTDTYCKNCKKLIGTMDITKASQLVEVTTRSKESILCQKCDESILPRYSDIKDELQKLNMDADFPQKYVQIKWTELREVLKKYKAVR